MKRLLSLALLICITAAVLPAEAERTDVTDILVIHLAPGEARMVEAGDITTPEKKSGVWITTEKGHGMLSTGRITTVNSDSIDMDATGGSLIVSCGDADHAVRGALSQIKVRDGGFVSLSGGNFRTREGQGFLIEATEGSAVRIRMGEAESKGLFGMMADVNDRSTMMLKAKKIRNDGGYGLWLTCRAKGSGDEALVSMDVDELEGTGYALNLQEYGSGYYTILRFGKVTAGDIGLRLSLDGGTATDIAVDGDIIAGRIGVKLYSDDRVKMIVLGTIQAGEAPILVANMSGRSGVGVNDESQGILVWRIIPTVSGHTVMLQGRETDSVVESENTEVMEKAIRYIIRTEDSGSAVFTLKKENGEDIRMSFGYPVACEGERILVQAEAAEGYKVTGVMNGEEEKVPLEKDENGNWYLDMPRGGGVSLSAVTEPAD